MAAQLRPRSLKVTDRFPMLSFTIWTDSPPRVAEVVLATDLKYFTQKEGRTPSTFYTSREHGILSLPRGEAVYVVPPEVLARFISADKLWFGLATATPPTATDWTVDVMPTASSPYISLGELSDRALRRVRMFPTRVSGAYIAGPASVAEWAGDRAQPGTTPAAPAPAVGQPAPAASGGAPSPSAAPPSPADVPYDDGFGPLPPLKADGQSPATATPSATAPTPSTIAPAPATLPSTTAAPAATAAGLAFGRAFDVDPENMGIDAAPYSDDSASPPEAQASALALTTADYSGVSRIAPSPAFTAGRNGTTIDRIVIHITDAPTTSSTVNTFTAAGAQASAHYLVGQDGEIVQFVNEADTAWHAKGANRRSIGIEHVAIKQGGACYPKPGGGQQCYPYTPPTDTQYCESAALVTYLCDKYGLTPDRTTIIGHREADPHTSHGSCPDGAWDWDHFMNLVSNRFCAPQPQPTGQSLGVAHALDGGGNTIEIKYRAFIPSPLIKGPMSDYDLGSHLIGGEDFGGDNRGFSYDQGTSRAEITATLTLGADSGISNLRTIDRHWGESTAYDSTYTYHVDGKPDWWMDKVAGGPGPSRRARLAVSDSNLRIYQGASTTTRSILAMTSQSSVVSIEMAGALPLITSPDIDSDIAIYLKQGANGPEVMIVGDHDGFPAHELYINRQLVYSYDPVANGKGPDSLMAPTDQDISTSWIPIQPLPAAAAQSLGAGARPVAARASGRKAQLSHSMAGSSLVFADVPGPWYTVDYKHVKLTAVAWDNAPEQPVAFVFFGHPNVDFDGSPTAYHPDDIGDDNLANAVSDDGRWVGVVAMTPSDPQVANGNALLDQRPEREKKGRYPVIQQAKNGDPSPGYYVSQTARAADASQPAYAQRRYFDASRVPYGALSGKLRDQGMALGDFGLAIRHDQALQSPFYFVDSGGAQSSALGEGSQKVGTNLGGSGRGSRFNNNFPVSFIVFPHSAADQSGALDETAIGAGVSAQLAQLATASNARDLALLMAANEAAPGGTPAGKAGLDAYAADPSRPLPANFGTVCAGLRAFGFALPDPAAAQSYGSARALDADDWSINWDEVYPIPQPTDNSCWATAAAMVIGWRDRQSVSPELIAQCHNLTSSLTSGLAPGDKRAFANAIGLTVEPNACYTPEGFRDVLEANGPIWVTADVPGIHAIVVTGMYRKDGAYYVRITDPWDRVVGTPGAPGNYADTHQTGSQYIMTYDAFTTEFEAAGNIDRIQLLHSGGTFGHTINRGSATGAGYAFSLGSKPSQRAVAHARGLGDGAAGECGLGVGTALTRQASSKNGRNYDLAQLAGMVLPDNALAGGAGTPAMPGERVVLDDWPYIEGPSGRTQAGVAIDWKFQNGAVGDIAITPTEGQVLDGWSATVRADICRNGSTPERVGLKVRVTTTFSRSDEEDQVAVSEVTLSGDGRQQTRHGADRAPAEPVAPSAPVPSPAPAPVPQQQLQPA